MKKYTSNLSFPATMVVGMAQPIDDRFVVAKQADLYNINTWKVGSAYLHYQGMSVVAADTGIQYTYIGKSEDINEVTRSTNWIQQINKKDTATEISEATGNGVQDAKLVSASAVRNYVAKKINNVGAAFVYKGSVESKDNLPTGNDPQVPVALGHVYNTKDTGMNYVCYNIEGKYAVNPYGDIQLEALTGDIHSAVNFSADTWTKRTIQTEIAAMASAGTAKFAIGFGSKDLPTRLINYTPANDYSKIIVAGYDSAENKLYIATGVSTDGTKLISQDFLGSDPITIDSSAIFTPEKLGEVRCNWDALGQAFTIQWN